jgi:hypothetical protein
MRPGPAAAAAAATDGRSAAAAGSGSGCPRLIGGAVTRKDPIFKDRPDDLTAIERGTGEVRARVS